MNTVLHTDREFLFNDLGKTDVHPRGKKDKANDDFLFSSHNTPDLYEDPVLA